MKYTIGEIYEKLDVLKHFEKLLRGNYDTITINVNDCRAIADLLEEHQDLLLNIKVDI